MAKRKNFYFFTHTKNLTFNRDFLKEEESKKLNFRKQQKKDPQKSFISETLSEKKRSDFEFCRT